MYTKEELRQHQVVSTIPTRQVELDGTVRRPITIAYLDNETYDKTVNGQTERNIPKW